MSVGSSQQYGAGEILGRKDNPDWPEEMQKRRKVAQKTKTCANCGHPIKHPQKWFCADWYCSDAFFVYYYGLPWQWVRYEVIQRDDHTCQKCGRECPAKHIKKSYYGSGVCVCEVDHILEVAMGGKDEDKNLQTLCHDCHVKKTTEFLRELRAQQAFDRKMLKDRLYEKAVIPLEQFT